MRHLTKAAMLAAVTLAALTGCTGKATEPFRDAPASGVHNDQAADNVEMPDGFSNVATKCDHGNRVYVAYHGNSTYAALAVVPTDPTCR